jgi:cysteine desulfurase / selenocysteine lyase
VNLPCGPSFDVASIKAQFPIFDTLIDGRPIVYADSANSSQKPRAVIDAMSTFMETAYSPIGRSSYRLAVGATDAYEQARSAVATFINAASPTGVVFTKNATEAMNLIVSAWGRANLRAGDPVVLSLMEHHANIVPWQMLAAERGIELRWIGLTHDGQLDLSNLDELLAGAKMLSITAMSNVMGTITPVSRMVEAAKKVGALTVVDACQFVPHNVTDVQAWGCDMMAFSSHKLCGPTGIGVLWARPELLEAMPPFLGGGSMIDEVRLDGFDVAPVPQKFEAGTPPIVEAVGLHAAIDWLTNLGMAQVRRHEMDLTQYALDVLTRRFGDEIQILGPQNVELRGATFAFGFRGIHPHDLSQILDEKNVCVRAGHHCAKPLHRSLGVGATTRASFYVYNDESDVDALADALDSATDIFG